MNIGPLSFSAPLWLTFLPIAVYAFWIWHRFVRWSGGPSLRNGLPYLRVIALLSLVLAAAGAEWNTRVRGVDLHLILDRSASIDTEARRRSDLALEEIRSQMGDHDRIALYAYGRETVVMTHLTSESVSAQGTALSDPTATNLEAALQNVLQHVDEQANSRFVVFSDGLETAGDAGALIPNLNERGIPVDIFPLGMLSDDETAVERLTAPVSVSPGEPYVVRAVISSTSQTRAQLSLYRNGDLIADHESPLEVGQTVIRFTGLSEPPDSSDRSATLELRIQPELDTFSENNVGFATVQVQGPAPVLILSEQIERAEALRALLGDSQIHAEASTVSTAALDARALTQYRAVIVDNVPSYQFSRRQMEEIAHYVRAMGGGLLVLGGDRSFGLGGYQKTPIEEILPVSMDAPQNLVMPSLAMILVIDRSGSMSERQGAYSKLDLAKEAALGVLDVVQDHDLLGVVVFDSTARWVVPLEPVSNRVLFAGPIAAVNADGGTNIAPALTEAQAALQEVEASLKHVLLLTDGISSPGDFEGISRSMLQNGITTSTVGIGRDADRELLRKLAEWGNGRYYYTDDIHSVPQIFATETTIVSRPIRIDKPFNPIWDQRADFWTPTDALPTLGGYVLTTAKTASAVHLRAPDESPVLSTWRHGLGRTAAFTSSLTDPWGEEWLQWSESRAFWGQLLRWLMRTDPADGLHTQLVLDGSMGELSVDALDQSGKYVNFLDLEALVLTPEGEELIVPLSQTHPGRYEAQFPARTQGVYVGTISERHRDMTSALQEERPRSVTIGAVLPYPDEYRILRPETGALYRLAVGTGGRILRDPATESIAPLFTHPTPVRRARTLVPWLLSLAFLAFVADIFVRYLTAEALSRFGQSLASVVNESEDSPERKLQARMREEQEYLEEMMQQRDRSTSDDFRRSADAGRFLAARRKREDEER